MEAGDAVNILFRVCGEWNSIQGLSTVVTGKTVNMVGATTRPEQLIGDRLSTFCAFFQGVLIAALADGLSLDVVEARAG